MHTQDINNNKVESSKVYHQNMGRIALKKAKAKKGAQKDVVVKATEQKGIDNTSKYEKPALTLPVISSFMKELEADASKSSVIAIIGEVLALQARTSSDTWRLRFDQATKASLAALNEAPALAEAVKGAADAQANATRTEAVMSGIAGVTSLAGAAASVGLGLKSNIETDAPKDLTAAATEDVANTQADDVNGLDDTASSVSDDSTVSDANAVQDEGLITKGKNLLKNLHGEKVTKKFTRALDMVSESFKHAQGVAMFTGIATGGANAVGKGIQANFQGQQGTHQATKQLEESYVRFEGSLEQQAQYTPAQQKIDSDMQALKSASDTVTSTVISMYRVA